jgi:hypothetical protein
MILSTETTSTAGLLLLSVTAIEFGGTFLLRIARGRHPVTDIQRTFFRAGHAHAGVLVILALVVQLYCDGLALEGPLGALARSGVPASALLIPGGFFFSVTPAGSTVANRFIVLIHVGVAVLGASVVALGWALLTA